SDSFARHFSLPSFPTRRSSALGGGVLFVGGASGAGDADDAAVADADDVADGAECAERAVPGVGCAGAFGVGGGAVSCAAPAWARSEEHTSELQSRFDLVCRRLL